ncbi:M16 family metallopeptidase [Tuwongella immobilis]|uniref:Peptidase M16 C-terminal domain-containing protein n=1 Tax=Tuwongella immobilis TaxID=692036 RepID=A0A6C2YV45_9BACT|nr:pitrilysin family protein [Tuwongella immobilis]VIP04785.1 peptidase m16 : Putative Zn-dependent peptidase OS=Singulisphaera acidiphila (strain ATCC BAA-1392 / DSM 18658 / VKM B-2454 / MOB10) GN=Sinac_0823 PE=3 SV=1: Peptidase_M16: Peptidase_M16_C [Tuwongella immobilis]VTS06929.1 peptidase m16 : Putative Zn-dependent peptidase OS=Singulisphaera acidiphila (strain ATCC BAA-1392 / DSM 18658 / VKM B-2454 / MOB10) GN=Sinac_0823 PE=3 SV=1: Peptidase_M16: Peptidase_M16_C [Tuwongella immobilis]
MQRRFFAEGIDVPQEVFQHTWANGLTLLAESMPHVRSAAISVLVPAGFIHDPDNQLGLVNVLSELIIRGAGERDNRALSLAMDQLGLDRDTSAGTFTFSIFGTTVARNVSKTLELFADIMRRPHLSEDELEPIQDLAVQELQALEDAPDRKLMVELRRRYYPYPLSKDRRGTLSGIENLDIHAIREFYQRFFRAKGAIITVAGNIQWAELKDQVDRLFGDWQTGPEVSVPLGPNQSTRSHIVKETTQTQIAMVFPSVPLSHADYYVAKAAVGVLSGGMSSRLFTEVREKRGLVYSVGASHESLRDRGSIVGYAGTRNERAQETLDVMLEEFGKLAQGIEVDELDRVKAGLKSSLIMAEESTAARARALASDWFSLGRIRSLDEIQQAVQELKPDAIVDYLHRTPLENPSIVTLGPAPLKQTS